MANTHLRSTLSRAINSENEGILGARTKMVGKAALQAPAAGGLKARPVRGVMQDIGNNGAVLKGRETTNKGEQIFIGCDFFWQLKLEFL